MTRRSFHNRDANDGRTTREWKFTLDFAAFCVSTNDITAIVEKYRPSELASLNAKDRSVIETLLASIVE